MPQWLKGREAEVIALVREHGPDLSRIAEQMGTTSGAVDIAKRRDPALREGWFAAVAAWKKAGGVLANDGRRGRQPDAEPASTTETADAIVHVTPVSADVRTLDNLLAQCQPDLAVWEVERWLANKWPVGAKHPETGEITVTPLFQVKAWFRRKAGPGLAEFRDALLAEIRETPRAPALVLRHALPPAEERHMLEVSAFDVHFGKLAWGEEAGEDYDVKLADEAFRDALVDLLRKANGFPIQRFLFPFGNDLLQTDNLQGTTTGGTPQDTDSRYLKAFRHARRAMSWALREMADRAPVVGKSVPGNHDRLTVFTLGEVLDAEFGRDARVTIDNSPKLRKYERFGVNLIGFTHGSEEKHADLPLIMAQEQPQAWSETVHREWHVGHLHKSKETRYTAGDSFNGVRVRILPSLCAADAWHYSKGYVGERRSAEAYLWNFATGYAGHLSSSVRPASGPAAAASAVQAAA